MADRATPPDARRTSPRTSRRAGLPCWRRGWRRHEHAVADPSVAADSVAGERGLAWDERAELWHTVRALPPQQRAAVVLRYYEELSEAETARVLGLSVGTVKFDTSRDLTALRRRVAGARPSAA